MPKRTIEESSGAGELEERIKPGRTEPHDSREQLVTIPGAKIWLAYLTIAAKRERQMAYEQGQMILYCHDRELVIPLHTEDEKRGGNLQGAYKDRKDRIILFRSNSGGFDKKPDAVVFLELTDKGEEKYFGYAKCAYQGDPEKFRKTRLAGYMSSDMGGMLVRDPYQNQGIAHVGTAKAERHSRAINGGKYIFTMLNMDHRYEEQTRRRQESFIRIYTRLGYSSEITEDEKKVKLSKTGEPNPEDDMSRFHIIEAINPETGRAETFRFEKRA